MYLLAGGEHLARNGADRATELRNPRPRTRHPLSNPCAFAPIEPPKKNLLGAQQPKLKQKNPALTDREARAP